MAEDFNRSRLMFASFLTLVASGAGFATRAAMGGEWETAFNIGGQQFGAIMGAGFLGFGMMIFFGGILTEKFGYKTLMGVAFLLHIVSAVMLFAARPLYDASVSTDAAAATKSAYQILFYSVFLFSIAQGLYEAVINPMIGQLYPENQTHYLNILHAGWPGGMILGGLMAACFVGKDAWIMRIERWEIPLASFALIVLWYGFLAFSTSFPKTVGQKTSFDFGKLFSCFLSPIFILLLLLHACIGYVELGVDSWVSKLMENLLPNAIVILIYTSFLMFMLRFFAGPIAHAINPIGLLLISSIVACGGLFWLGSDIQSVTTIFIAATVYSLGKAFFWPTMLGVAGERFPQSGAIAMGALGAAGMLTVGLLAGEAIGYKQASNASTHLKEVAPEVFERYADNKDKAFLWLPPYRPLHPKLAGAVSSISKKADGSLDLSSFDKLEKENDSETSAKIANLRPTAEADSAKVKESNIYGGRRALTLTAWVPAMMAVGYLLLLGYFASIGGYKKLTVNENGDVVEDNQQH